MRIAMVSGHACPRVQKMALPLITKGHTLHNISKKEPMTVNYYATSTLCNHIEQYINAFKVYSKVVDIFHVHNEPSWFVQAIKEVCDVPVVLDVHDSNLARLTSEKEEELREANTPGVVRVSTEERTNFQLADSLVFPGEVFADLVCNEFKLTQPRLILPSYINEDGLQYNSYVWQGGLVYEGRVDLTDECKDNNHGFVYCDYFELAQKAKEIGIQFHIYPCRSDEPFVKKYEETCFLHPPKNPVQLLGSLQKHDWGVLGNVFPTSEWEVAFPNKLFEYMAANVPIVAINARACAEFLKETGMGIEVQSLEELKERWPEHETVRKTLIKRRREFVMEKHIHKLEDLYERTFHDPR